MKHTKGDWTSTKMIGEENHCICAQVFDNDGKSLCYIDSRYGEIEATANAKLVAAAPVLLEFAIEMTRRYPNSPWIYEQGNEAIKKATD
jgi:hypothetical protein